MASLRDRQRERRRGDIMDAAWELIGQKGLDATSMEEIATRAEVGTATVYKYFGSKPELMQALFERYIEEEAERGQPVLQQPPERLVDGMSALFEQYLHGMATRCSPLLMREFYVLSMSKQLDYGRQTYQLKQRFMTQVLQLAEHYKRTGQIRGEVLAAEAAMLCYSAVTVPFSLFALQVGMDEESARRQVRRLLELTFAGIGPRTSPRNEGQSDA